MAFSLRKNSDSGIVGLDIDGRYIAAAKVDGGRLTTVASSELPPGALNDGEVVDREALSAALKEFVADHKLPRRVRLGISNQQIVVRVLELPRIDDDSERDAALRFQAAEAIAMPLDEAVLDHQVAGFVNSGEGAERMQVVVVAARRTMIEEYMGAVKDAGLKVEGIDLDAFALVRMLANQAFPEAPPAEPISVEDVPFTDEVASEDGYEEVAGYEDAALEPEAPTAVLEPEVPVAAPIPASADATLDREPSTARVLCHLGGVSNLAIAVGSSCFFTRTLSTHFGADGAGARLADEIRLSIDYYMAQAGALPVGDVLISGDGAGDRQLVADIGAQLGLPVGVAAPLGSLDSSAIPPHDDPSRYTVAAGLALGEAA